ncbi:MAG: TIGR00266 family protein [bacterium]
MSNEPVQVLNKVPESEIIDNKQKDSPGISYKTIGTTLQALAVQLDENEIIISETGKMSWMTDNIQLNTKAQGIGKMLSRFFAAESLFVNEFQCLAGTGIVTFSTEQAGKIVPVDLDATKPGIIFQRGSYLCSEVGIERNTILMKKIATGLFGGKGFIMQKLSGKGRAHLIADGEVVMYELRENDSILVDHGNLVAYEETVDFDIRTVGGGMKNWIFGGEGIFLGMMKGPGKVWLQTRKMNLSAEIIRKSMMTNTSGGFGARGSMSNPLGCIFSAFISFAIFLFFIILMIVSNK